MLINEWISSERVEKPSGLSEFLANTLLAALPNYRTLRRTNGK